MTKTKVPTKAEKAAALRRAYTQFIVELERLQAAITAVHKTAALIAKHMD